MSWWVQGRVECEVALATQFHLQQYIKRQFTFKWTNFVLHLITGNTPVLSTHNKSIQRRFRRVLKEREITIHKGSKAKQVNAKTIELDNGETLHADAIIWATHASAPTWYQRIWASS